MSSEVKPSPSHLSNPAKIAETIDNRQSVKKIINSINSKERSIKFYIPLHRVINQLNQEIFIHHHMLPGIPLTKFDSSWDGELPMGFFEQFPHRSLLPSMITNQVRHDGKKDPVTLLLQKQKEYQKFWSTAKAFNTKKSKKKPCYTWMSDDVLHCPQFYIEAAKQLENKPDEYFNANYNWYYAGKGNLHIVKLYDMDYLLHSDFNTLFVTPFSKDLLTVDLTHSHKFECNEDMHIFETVHSLNFIAIRTKFKVILLKVSLTENDIKLEKLKEIDSKWTVTSITFDEYHKNILYITTLEWQLTIVNLDRLTGRSVKLRGKYTTLVNNWSTVIGSERGYFIHLNKKSVTLYDKRTNEAFQRWKSLEQVVDIRTCNSLSAGTYCTGRPQMYILSSHHIFLFDMRCDKTPGNKPKPIQKWAHGMQAMPTYITIKENKEYNRDTVCMSSQWVEDLTLLSNKADILHTYKKPTTIGLPFHPPSIVDTFLEAQLKRLCCDLYNPIEKRLSTAISGVTIFENDKNEYRVLMMNSLGDISCHCFYPSERISFIDDDGPEKLHAWSQNCIKDDVIYPFSYVHDMSKMMNQLRRIPDSYVLGHRAVDAPRHKYCDKAIQKMYDNDEVDVQFLEIWKRDDTLGLINKSSEYNTEDHIDTINETVDNDSEPMDVDFTMPDDEF